MPLSAAFQGEAEEKEDGLPRDRQQQQHTQRRRPGVHRGVQPVTNVTSASAIDSVANRRTDRNFAILFTTNVVFSAYLCCRGSFSTLWYMTTPVEQAAPFYVGFFLGMVAAVTSWLSFACRIPVRLAASSTVLRRCRNWAMAHQKHKWSGVVTDDLYILSITAALGTYAVARGLQGPCPEGTSAWAAQTCNPQGALLNPIPRPPVHPSLISQHNCNRGRAPAPD